MVTDVVITGGAGFIGSQLAARLCADGHRVIAVDNLSTGRLEALPDSCDLIELDLSGPDIIRHLPRRADVVFHLAGQASSEVSMQNPRLDLLNNAVASMNTLDWAHSIDTGRLVFASTMGVYLDHAGGAVAEDAVISPKSPYGIHKRAVEMYLKAHPSLSSRSVTFRLFNVYGPGQDLTNMRQGMVSIFLAQMLRGDSIEVRGPLDRVRDFIFIDDVVDGLICGMRDEGRGLTFNLCTGRATRVAELLTLLFAAWPEDQVWSVRESARTPADIDFSVGNPGLAQRVFNWRPQYTLEQGLERMVASACQVPW